MEKVTLKSWLWEMTPTGEDNIKHLNLNSKVDMISIPIDENKLSNTEEPHPQVLDTLKSKLEFKGNIRLSKSGTSWNLFRDVLDNDSDMVNLSIEVS